jgi:hypothetical protein
MRQKRPVRSLAAATLAASLFVTIGGPNAPVAGAVDDPAVVGEWSPLIETGVVGVSASLLPTGKVVLWESRAGGIGSRAGLFDPATNTTELVTVPYARNIFCAGSSALADGRVLVTGGDPPSFSGNLDRNLGVTGVSIFDPSTETWSEETPMADARWYPSNVELADGRTLAFSGNDEVGVRTLTVELYDPSTHAWTTLPTTTSPDVGLYPRTLLLPNGKILIAGKLQKTRLFDPATNAFSVVGLFNFGARKENGAVLLPGLTKALAVGGQSNDGVVTNTTEILDLASPTPQWTYGAPMARPRINTNLVMLADGTVLAVGGGSGTPYGNPEKAAELYDPVTETWTTMAAQLANRTYHSTALLLPDGRVLSAGSTNSLPEETTVDIYSPPYLFKGPRPAITGAPAQVGYGASFDIASPDAADITRVALIKPGSVTHSVNMDQRYVDMSYTIGDGTVTATAPTSGNVAPPGYYMLVVVNSAGVPSIAEWVQLSGETKPIVWSFTPNQGTAGTVVTLGGSAFTGATDVAFNGISVGAGNFTVDSDLQITATVPDGATTGKISVTTPPGTGFSAADFFVTDGGTPPTITGFTPTAGGVGTTVTISGTNFTGASDVKFNTTSVGAGNFTVDSDTQITATVPSGATTGPISVATPSGIGTSSTPFSVVPAPTITSFTPTSGVTGTTVTINGTSFTATAEVKFNGVTATGFVFRTATKVKANVPAGATTGPISVTTASGTGTSSTDFVIASGPPTITSFTPTSGPVGTTVTITGTNFTGATTVKFGGVVAAFTVNSDTQITATVPTGAVTGKIVVKTAAGSGSSPTKFTVT